MKAHRHRLLRGEYDGCARRRVQTSYVAFAWEFHSPTAIKPAKLKGQKFTYTPEHAEFLRKTDKLCKLKYENV
jgi:hypothetical protein